MRLLSTGVNVVFDKEKFGIDRLEISQGTVLAESELYEIGSILPNFRWRQLEIDEVTALMPNSCKSTNALVRLIKFPSEILINFHKSLWGVDLTDRKAVKNVAGSKLSWNSFCEFKEFFRELQGLDSFTAGPSGTGGICVKPNNLPSVTTQPGTDKYIGLHVDSWFNYAEGTRYMAPVRICGNFGFDDRFFLFFYLNADQISGIEKDYDAHRMSVSAQARRFLRKNPDCGIIRIRLLPGEAYIAATENLVHDASTLGASRVDIAAHVLG